MLMKVQSSLSLRVFTLGLRANNRSSQALGTMLPRRVSIDEARYCSPLGGSPWYVYFLVFLGPRPTYFSLLFFLWGCLISLFFCCWCHVAFPFSHVVVSFVSFAFACCLVLLYMILVSHTVVSARVSFTTSSVSVLQIRSIAVAF
jgi:hypothetical protein